MQSPIPEPSTALIITGVKTTGTGLWKLWIAYGNSKEMGELLRASLERAICPDRPQAKEAKALASDLEAALRSTGVPRHGKPGVLGRVRGLGRKVLPRKARLRQVPEMRVFGPSFDEHLAGWLRETTESGGFAERLAAVECARHELTLDELVGRFPQMFEDELFSEELASDFREGLTRELLITHLVREERARRTSLRGRALTAGASAALPGGVGFVAADALGASDPAAAAIGLATAAVGAAIGSTAVERTGRVTVEQSAARATVLCWVAGVLAQLTGQPTPPDSEALRAILYAILRDAVHGRLQWPERLAEGTSEVRQLRKIVAAAGDTLLDRELMQFEAALQDASADVGLRQRALAQLYGVIAACDLRTSAVQ